MFKQHIYHIFVDSISDILPCDKTLNFALNNKRKHDHLTVSQELPKRADKASLLTASGMLLHAFPPMFITRHFVKFWKTVFTNMADDRILQHIWIH